jgi:hypothetical protein
MHALPVGGVVFIVALSPFTLYPYLLSIRVLFSKLSPSNHYALDPGFVFIKKMRIYEYDEYRFVDVM